MAAGKNQFNIYTTYYESFLALSVSIKVDEHQLMMETLSSSQAPVLRYGDTKFTTEYLKESLSMLRRLGICSSMYCVDVGISH